MTTNGITLFASEIHSVMPSPLIEKLHQCCFFFDKLNHNAACTESLIQITLGSMLWMLEVESISSVIVVLVDR